MQIQPDDWPAVSQLLDEALELPPSEHPRWLAGLGGDAQRHRATLERLLSERARMETQDFLQTLPKFVATTNDADATGAAEARQVGPYTLLRELGRGGMGRVWLAERSDGMIRRPVALKLPHVGLTANSTFAERLERERDILASLSNPHIARLYDAGVSGDGQPYLALEFVEGQPITTYCDRQRLDTEQRVRLVMQVLDAVQHAHQALVVHRDLKPANVLVTAAGEVKLLDFGVAKLIAPDGATHETELTELGGHPLTPSYASPEQLAGRPIGTASDVYALGVMLYELLCGQRPYRLKRDSRGALEDAILAADVVRPSASIPSDESAAVRGGASARKLAAQLAGDLDTIVLKALRKDPAERYPTAEAFRDDLRRWLGAEPVLARPQSRGYRATRFIARHRLSIAAAAGLVLAISAGVSTTVWQARQAQREAARAQAALDFVTGLFKQVHPSKAHGKEISAREMLTLGEHELATRYTGEPHVGAELRLVLADLYASVGEARKAIPVAEAALKTIVEQEGAGSLAQGDALVDLGAYYADAHQPARALALYDEARAILERHADRRRDELLLLDSHRAYALLDAERFAEAVALFDTLLPQLTARYGADSWEVVRNRSHTATALAGLGRTAEALAIHRQIGPGLARHEAAQPSGVIEVRYERGALQLRSHDGEGARETLLALIPDNERLLGADNTATLAMINALIVALNESGRYAEIAHWNDEAVARAKRTLGPDDRETRTFESNGFIYAYVGRLADAEAATAAALDHVERVKGLPAPSRRTYQRHLAAALLAGHKPAQALAVLQALAREEPEAKPPATDREVGATLTYIAYARAAQGDWPAALQAALYAEAHLAKARDPSVPRAHALLVHALSLMHQSQLKEADTLLTEAEALLKARLIATHPDLRVLDLARAQLMRQSGHEADATRLEAAARESLKSAGVVPTEPVAMLF